MAIGVPKSVSTNATAAATITARIAPPPRRLPPDRALGHPLSASDQCRDRRRIRSARSTYPATRLFGAFGPLDIVGETVPVTMRDVVPDIGRDVVDGFSKSS